MHNNIMLVKEDLERHKVSVILPGEKEELSLYLIMIDASTSKLKDLKETYGKKVTETHLKIAKKIFGEGETENTYGVLVNEKLQMVFSFNRDFADYDRKKKIIVFKDIDDVLLEKIKVKGEKKKEVEKTTLIRKLEDLSVVPMPDTRSRGGGRGRILYSLAEKEKT